MSPDGHAGPVTGSVPWEGDTMSDDVARPGQPGLSHLREGLRRRSHLFEDPGAYLAGVDDAVEALSAADDTATVARVRASAMGFAIAEGGELDPVAELGQLSGADPIRLLAARRQLESFEHVDRHVRRTASDLLLAALDCTSQRQEHDHDVVFYRDTAELSDAVATYLAPAVTAAGSTAIVVATPEHRERFLEVLRGRGVVTDPRRGYLALDADEVLADFMVEGRPDPTRFRTQVLSRIADLDPDASHIRVYGEMVALLWAQGNASAAIELEGLWNEAAQHVPFTLLCGYPEQVLDDPAHADALREVCRRHRRVLPAAG
jgi:hypothetical protein